MRINLVRGVFALLLVTLGLAACSTLNVGTALRLQQVDFLNDDIASMVIAVDVPVVLVPLPDQSHFVLTARTADGQEKRVEADLARAVTAELFDTLPPPAQDRGYFIFEIAEESKQAIRAFQADMRKLSSAAGGPGGALTTTMDMHFCKTAEIDPARTLFSASIALPGSSSLDPIISGMSLQELQSQSGQTPVLSCAEAMQ